MDKQKKDRILATVSRALDYQFETYSWEQMINDAMYGEFTDEEIQWAKEHISYKVDVV